MGNKQAVSSQHAAREMSFFEQYDLVIGSKLFDSEFYLSKYKDVAALGIDPVLHYIERGGLEGRDPHKDFDTAFYVQQCAQHGVRAGNPLVHFILEGRALGLSPNKHSASKTKKPDDTDHHLNVLLQSGLFNRQYYNAQVPKPYATDLAALRDYYVDGFKHGRKPNPYFDASWYLKTYADVNEAGINPFYHYCVQGDFEGRRPGPLFDPVWYRKKYGIAANENTLAHYLKHCASSRFSPLPDFDAEYYGSNNKDVREARVDPFEHFFFTGYREGRNPSDHFNIRFYVKRYLGGSYATHPFVHYLEHKHQPGVHGKPLESEVAISRAIKQFTKPGIEFEEFKPLPVTAPRRAKVLAYYLPQFHAFPENDSWWGKGFTEWTNIARGASRFKGHYQPRVPRDLGFYDLDSAATIKRQVDMAKGAGLYGFVFYYYWFNGKRLMDKPVNLFLDDATIEMPFALMWANENWTRRWDGDEHQVLIRQDYDPADDHSLLEDFARHFRDPRYIRIGNRPLLMIYRPGLIPEVKQVLARWRDMFRTQFGEEPILLMAQGFGETDPTKFGLDGAIEFPPHKVAANLPTQNDKAELLDADFTGQIFNYDDVVTRSVEEPMPSFPLIKAAFPSWDNDARRQGTGMIFNGSSPAKYEAWLEQLIKKASERPFLGERFVCVNAWNEWCEAAYLEPDLYYGSAYLNATARAVSGAVGDTGEYKLLLVGHDAYLHGAQYLLLNIARRLKGDFGLMVEILLLQGGKPEMETAYREVAPVTIAADGKTLSAALTSYRKRGFRSAIVNTVAAGHVIPELHDHGIEAISLVHELPRIVREKNLRQGAQAALTVSRRTIFASAVVRDQLAKEVGVPVDDRMMILPQGAYKTLQASSSAIDDVRKELGASDGEKIVVGLGYADLRKGFDLFLQLWRHCNQTPSARVHFCWIGDIDVTLKQWLVGEIDHAIASGTFHMPGFRGDVDPWLVASDAFVLTSREDPFPTVVHEALSAGLPVVVFDGSGGIPDFLQLHGMGVVVPHCDVIQMAKALETELRTDNLGAKERRKEFVRSHLDFGSYVGKLLELALPEVSKVSVAVPNYNYAKYMPQRLGTVFQQTYPVHEVIVLDDCSKDDSAVVIPKIASEWNRKITFSPNSLNSGSVFAQWRKAAEMATGEYVWIAEADDESDASFLGAVVESMRADPKICLGFSDSRAVDSHGNRLGDSYKPYYAELEPGALSASEIYEGSEFVRRYLSVRNLILNVSSVVWRRDTLLRVLETCKAELGTFRMAGDWRLYLEALGEPGARISYVGDALNIHRRHAQSVTHALDLDRHVAEIIQCHKIAAGKFGLPVAVRNKQARYAANVERQLRAGTLTQGTAQPQTKGARKRTKTA